MLYHMCFKSPLVTACTTCLTLVAAFAPFSPALGQATSESDHDHGDEIVVTAIIPRSHVDVLAGTSVLSGNSLALAMRPNLGETLTRQPGVSATSFGPTASRPILRGFSGDRIRLLTDGIGSFDVSATSVDHAVAVNPMLAERIEVLHGPAALLYGASAVGGVVNVIDSRIPTRQPTDGHAMELTSTYGTAAQERSLSGKAEISLGSNFVAHVDGSYSRSADLHTGGYILAPVQRDEALASEDPDVAALADLKGDLPNSASESWNYAGSLTWLDGDGASFGASISSLHNLYGVPVRYSLVPGMSAEAPRIRMNQTRVDFRGQIPIESGFIDEIKLRGGWADYHHDELETDGAIGTTFLAKGTEARLEITQTRNNGWDGAFGAQFLLRKTQIVGDEKFQPDSKSTNFGLFTIQSLDLGDTRMEAGARFEHADIAAQADAMLGNAAYSRTFDTFSASIGANHAISPDWRIGINFSRSERAPSADELFSRGNHAGTQSFELGNPDFKTERGLGMEALLHGRGRDYHVSFSAYFNRFSNFIYDHVVDDAVCMAANGGTPLDFPCYLFSQAQAVYFGAEFQADMTITRIGDSSVTLDALADYTHATIIDGGPVPRIPPFRMLGGVTVGNDQLSGRLEVEHDFAQNRVGMNETPTAAFTLVNASLSWKPLAKNPAMKLQFSANNIFNVVARRHASILKDFAPLAGRDVRLTFSLDV